MKKKGLLFGALCLVMLFLVTGCGKKTAITTSEFNSKAEKAGYQTTDITAQYSSYKHVKEATIAKNDNYQVEFYVITSEEEAKGMYETNKSDFENSKGSSSSYSSVELGNYSTYAQTSSGKYKYIARVDSTLLYIDVDEKYKDDVKKFVKELGY